MGGARKLRYPCPLIMGSVMKWGGAHRLEFRGHRFHWIPEW